MEGETVVEAVGGQRAEVLDGLGASSSKNSIAIVPWFVWSLAVLMRHTVPRGAGRAAKIARLAPTRAGRRSAPRYCVVATAPRRLPRAGGPAGAQETGVVSVVALDVLSAKIALSALTVGTTVPA